MAEPVRETDVQDSDKHLPVVDRTWVDVQKKTFTRWCNQFLAERRLKVEDLQKDLGDGLNLVNLLEIISSKSLGRFNKKPTTRYHYLENNSCALNFIKSEGLQLVGIGPEDVVDGKLKLILGLIWTLILRYQINVIGEGSPKWELLEWVKRQTEPYNIKKPLRNFTTDWQDGTTLAALVDSIQPGILTPTDMSALTKDPYKDTDNAMQTALEAYEIPRLMDVNDLVECPDELSLMTYVSAFRNYLGEEARRQREELARKKRTADPATCYAYGPGLEGAETYQPAEFTIVAKNCFDEELTAGGDQFEVTINGPDGNVAPTVSDNGDGKYPASYTVTLPGEYTISIKLRGEDIKGSPYSVNANGPDAGYSTASGPGVEGHVVKSSAPFTVTSFNAQGQRVNTGGDPFKVQVQGPEEVADPQLTDNGDGTYNGEYAVSAPGRYFVNITLNDAPIQGSPFKVLFEGARAGNSWAEGPGLEGGQTGKPAVFTIHGVDPEGNPRQEGGDPFKVEVTGPENVPAQVQDNGDGTYSVTYNPTVPGDYNVAVSLHDEPIKDAPFDVRIKPSPDASNCWAEGPALHGLVDNEPGLFTIHAVDADGNPRADGGDEFVVDINGPEGKYPAQITDNGDGTYGVSFDPEHAGDYEIGVNYEDAPIKDAPFRVRCKEGTDAEHSGFGVFSFTVQSRDKHGNNKTFGGDNFAVSISGPNDSEVEVETTDNNDGTYTAVYALTGEQGDVFSIVASLNSKKIGAFKQNL
ncbi:Calponiny domain-containing protein [Balamuthia mandrillaris]